jgi:hypothetical protein
MRPRSMSPHTSCVFPAQKGFGDAGDAGDTFCTSLTMETIRVVVFLPWDTSSAAWPGMMPSG